MNWWYAIAGSCVIVGLAVLWGIRSLRSTKPEPLSFERPRPHVPGTDKRERFVSLAREEAERPLRNAGRV